MRVGNPIRGIKALVWLGVTATSVALVISAASAAAPAMKPEAGTIHVYLVNTSLNPNARNNVLITGAFSDHGTGKNGIWALTEGTIKVNNAAVAAIAKSPNFGTSYAASCSFDGVARGPVIIVSGTGAYVGITGTLAFTLTEAGEGSLLKNGNCNPSSNAPAVAEDLIGTGSGKVSFK